MSREREMELLPALTETKSKMVKNQRFRSLKLVNVDLDEVFDDKPFGADYGRLENGLRYYVRLNSKPRMRAAIALAVKVGSVNEENDERGVAHIVEHLAFSATTKYTNHDIVKFLESIGVEFGACQNATTSCDETLYELFVPVDKPELLSEALSILAEFSTEVRVSKDDLEKERGAVMEEYRANRNADGRMLDSDWALLLEGSKYAERLPIGLEKVIRTVTPEVVKQFYKKWYHLHNMAVVAVGDFADTQSVVELIKTHFGDKCSAPEPPFMPDCPVPSHEEPRFSCFVDSETDGSAVTISYKMPSSELKTVGGYKDILTQSMFFYALNKRFSKISHRKDPPFFSCSASAAVLISPTTNYTISASCKEKGTIQALESILTEVARVRLHGFSDREISVVRSSLLSEIESAYLQRDQMQSTHWRDEYIRHFLRNEAVIGIEYQAKLQKTLLPHISAPELSRFAEKLRTSVNCIVKVVEPSADAIVEHLKSVVSKINCLEEEGCLPLWDEEQIPEEIVTVLPNPGSIVEQHDYSSIGATELILSNGMRVCYKCTDFLADQVLFTGFSYGGLSEITESEFLSCSNGSCFAEEVGVYGYRPSVLMDMLAGKRVEVDYDIDVYTRTFYGDCSPSDLKTALQLVYQLFTTSITPGEEEVKIVMQKAEEGIHAKERDPYTAFADRVKEIIYGNSYFFRPIKFADLETVDPLRGCVYFNDCFKDPSTFTMVIVGNIDPAIAEPLILQFLGGIPRPTEPILHYNRDDLKDLPISFPAKTIREVVRSPMTEAQCSVQLRFQVELKNETLMEDTYLANDLSKLLEARIIQVLRFKHGQIYSAGVSLSLNDYKPSRTSDVRGDICISFSCDPDISSKLVDLALDEILQLQVLGPSEEEVASVLEIEQRAQETELEENYYWLNKLSASYKSRYYFGDIGTPVKIMDEARLKVRNSLTPATAQLALQRILPFPCKKQYTMVMIVPQTSRFKYLNTMFQSTWKTFGDAKILTGLAAVTILALSWWRRSRKTIKS